MFYCFLVPDYVQTGFVFNDYVVVQLGEDCELPSDPNDMLLVCKSETAISLG